MVRWNIGQRSKHFNPDDTNTQKKTRKKQQQAANNIAIGNNEFVDFIHALSHSSKAFREKEASKQKT